MEKRHAGRHGGLLDKALALEQRRDEWPLGRGLVKPSLRRGWVCKLGLGTWNWAGWRRVGIILKDHHHLATKFIKVICGPGQAQIRVRRWAKAQGKGQGR